MNSSFKQATGIVVAIAICELAGGIGAIFTTPSIATWYSTLVKPSFTPPSWLFGPVWTLLYALMGIAAFVVWNKGWNRPDVRTAVYIFVFQLLLNIMWSVIFFGLHNPLAAFVNIIVLWVAILTTIISFGRISRTAMWLLLPYILWVSFAAVLNYSLWVLN